MPISIITRSKKSSELRDLLINISDIKNIELEIIAVCIEKDESYNNIQNLKIIIENSQRFHARITGIKNANYKNILLLDSDQLISEDLLNELDKRKEDMIIIPEKSYNKNLTGKLMDDLRFRMERWAQKETTPEISVIPRFYKTNIIKNIVEHLDEKLIDNIIFHEDSTLYYEVFKKTHNIGFAKNYIYNYDPDLIMFIKKSYKYGRNYKDIKSFTEYKDIITLNNKININSFNLKELGIGKGEIILIIRAIAHLFGYFFRSTANQDE